MYIILIIGSSGSGKSTIGKLVAEQFGAGYIEVSDLVEELINTQNREEIKEMHAEGKNTPKAKEIFDKMLDRIKETYNHAIVVSGIREVELYARCYRVFGKIIPFLIVSDFNTRQVRLGVTSEELTKLDKADFALGFANFVTGPKRIEHVYDTTSLTPEQSASLIVHDIHAIVKYRRAEKQWES